MRDIIRNPMLYYVLIPVLIAVWPLLVWAAYLPKAERAWQDDQAQYAEGQTLILDILRLDPERLKLGDAPEISGEFTYAKAVGRVANLCGIPFPSNCSYNAGSIITSEGKKSQNARVTLADVDIVRAAKFLSTIQSTWVNLKCSRVKLTKKEGVPDQWSVEFTFWYYY